MELKNYLHCRKRHKCVGTLVTQQHVLTLANCFYALDPVRSAKLVMLAKVCQ